MTILCVPDAGTKARVRTDVWRSRNVLIVSFVTFLLQNRKPSLLHPPKLKKEKREAKKLESDSSSNLVKDNILSPNPSLVDPASVQVIGSVDGQGTLQSPGSGEPARRKKKMDKDKATTSKSKSHSPVKSTERPYRSEDC